MARYRVTGHAIIEAENESEAAEVAGHSETMWEIGRIQKLTPAGSRLAMLALAVWTLTPGSRAWALLLG